MLDPTRMHYVNAALIEELMTRYVQNLTAMSLCLIVAGAVATLDATSLLLKWPARTPGRAAWGL